MNMWKEKKTNFLMGPPIHLSVMLSQAEYKPRASLEKYPT